MAFDLVTIKKELEATRPTFEEMNLNKVSFAKELEYAMQAFQANPALLALNPDTVRNCLVNVALSGATLNPIMKMAYLVPRKGKCCLDMSYMGLIKVITDTGSVQSIKAKPVYSNEPFEIEQGSGGFVKHGFCKDGNVGYRIGAYSIATLNDGSDHIEWMYEYQLMAIKKRSPSGNSGPWVTDIDEMIRKTVIKRHWKFLPKSDRAILASQAIAFDDENNGIDFEAEKAEMEKGKSNPASTPNAPAEEALATQEDFQLLMNLLLHPALPDIVFGGVHKGVVGKNIETRYQANKLPKSKAEEYIKGLQAEIIAKGGTL